MAAVRGLGSVRVGDAIGDAPRRRGSSGAVPKTRPRAVVFARNPDQQGSLHAALIQLAEQDPLIDVRRDDHRHEIAVSLYGEVQKEVIGATLERDYGIAADFRETTTVCVERPAGVGEAEEVIFARTHTNITGPQLTPEHQPVQGHAGATDRPAAGRLRGRVPQRAQIRLVPLYLFHTREAFDRPAGDVRRRSAGRGPLRLAGDRLSRDHDRLGYASPETSAADFRRLTELVLMTALDRAGTWVCEPIADVSLEMPASTGPAVLAGLGRLGGRVRGQFSANGMTYADATLPVARVRTLQHQLPGLSSGEGIMQVRPGGYVPVGRDAPRRPRSRPSPLDRDAWLAAFAKRG